jgi:hypothetical protein
MKIHFFVSVLGGKVTLYYCMRRTWGPLGLAVHRCRKCSYRAKYLTAPSDGLLHIKYYGTQTRGYDIELSYYHQSQLNRATETRAQRPTSRGGVLAKTHAHEPIHRIIPRSNNRQVYSSQRAHGEVRKA